MKALVTCQYNQKPHELDGECVDVTHLPPVLLLDIDGVLNIDQPGAWPGPVSTRRVGGRFRWMPELVDRLRALNIEGRWCTTWCGYPKMLGELEDVLDLRFARAFGDRRPCETFGDLKVHAVLDALAEGRTIVWVDDNEVGAGRSLFPQIAEAERDGRALLIQPESRFGLQPADMDAIEAFCAARERMST